MIPWPVIFGLDQSVRGIRGVGPRLEETLGKRGIRTRGDLLGVMPARYQDRREPVPIAAAPFGTEVLVRGQVTGVRRKRQRQPGRVTVEMDIDDNGSLLTGVWFRPAARLEKVTEGQTVALFGKIVSYQDRLEMIHPEVAAEPDAPLTPEITPVYPDFEGIPAGTFRRLMVETRSMLAGLPPIFPRGWLAERKLSDPVEALRTLHGPPADRPGALPRPEQTRAWKHLAFFELFFLQLLLADSRRNRTAEAAVSTALSQAGDRFLSGLPFALTEGQQQAWEEIRAGLASADPMNRLLQGDVGCGKTVLALAAALEVAGQGRQVAIMAPTEVLAMQLFKVLTEQAGALSPEPRLLVGSLPEREKQEIRSGIEAGDLSIVVGTHALVAAGVRFQNLGLAVIDEQHRFGVSQRLALRSKARHPHLLVMTATPIPRSLALTLYGDLDLTVVAGLPPGRRPPATRILPSELRDKALERMAREVADGGRVYWVAPRIAARDNGDEEEDFSAVEFLWERIREHLPPQARAALAHGRMKTDEQMAAFADFRAGRSQVLVATSIVEVGLDVPEATLMIIEGADRFGLAQLHQLRGRVGRGEKPGLCLLVTDQPDSPRLKALARLTDGFALAEEDLKLRGPGDAVGAKQSGLTRFHWARLPGDLPLLLKARQEAADLAAGKPGLTAPEFKLVREITGRLSDLVRAEMTEAG